MHVAETVVEDSSLLMVLVALVVRGRPCADLCTLVQWVGVEGGPTIASERRHQRNQWQGGWKLDLW